MGVADAPVRRVTGDVMRADSDQLAVEEPLLIELNFERDGGRVTESVSVTMRTPGSDVELAMGFLYTEGIIASADEVDVPGAEPPISAGTRGCNTVRIEVRRGVPVDVRRLERHFYTTSSCGVCGKTSLEALAAGREVRLAPDRPVVSAATVHALPDTLRAAQAVFRQTGGLHAAALFDPAGRLLSLREDVGRHNALDKLIGAQLLAGALPLDDHLVLVSGRASFELMQKALMAGVPVLAAVGAPSSLAVETAEAYGATLLGFVRNGRFNVYAGARRLREAAEDASGGAGVPGDASGHSRGRVHAGDGDS
ncbi:MAG: formate dehydrogenase accessory sulfurtransferase FdhD [Gemmatimonadaceae bacterium]